MREHIFRVFFYGLPVQTFTVAFAIPGLQGNLCPRKSLDITKVENGGNMVRKTINPLFYIG